RIFFALREIFRAEKAALFDHHDVPAALGQVRGQCSAARTGADHDDIGASAQVTFVMRSLDDHDSDNLAEIDRLDGKARTLGPRPVETSQRTRGIINVGEKVNKTFQRIV